MARFLFVSLSIALLCDISHVAVGACMKYAQLQCLKFFKLLKYIKKK